MRSEFKTSKLNNGNTLAFYPDYPSELTILPNGDYFCSTNHNLCFERPTHSFMIKHLKPAGVNITIRRWIDSKQDNK